LILYTSLSLLLFLLSLPITFLFSFSDPYFLFN
jgi:hypothetical protein